MGPSLAIGVVRRFWGALHFGGQFCLPSDSDFGFSVPRGSSETKMCGGTLCWSGVVSGNGGCGPRALLSLVLKVVSLSPQVALVGPRPKRQGSHPEPRRLANPRFR